MSFDFGSILRQYSDNTGVAGSSAPGSDASAGQQEIADRHGFTLNEHALSLYGLCPACRKAA